MKPSLPEVERLAAFQDGALGPDEAQEIRASLAASPEGRDALGRLVRLGAAVAALPAPRLDPARRRALGARLETMARTRRLRARVGFSAAVLGAVATLVLALVWWSGREAGGLAEGAGGTHLRTGPGDFRLLSLGDRAVAFVGEQSEVAIPPAPAPIEVLQGAVRFVVKRRGGAPFVVRTGSADVVVLGTEFDVMVTEESTEVAVVRGRVEVRNPQGQRTLWPREQALVRRGQAPRLLVPVRGLVREGEPQVEARPAPSGPPNP